VTPLSRHDVAVPPSPHPERLLRDAHLLLANCGVNLGVQRVTRMVRDYLACGAAHSGWAFFDFLATQVQLTVEQRQEALANPAVARVIGYADPTGETAVRHVMQEASHERPHTRHHLP
jgi:hypothetical protein